MKKTIAYLVPAFPVLSETFIGTEIRAMESLGHRVVPIAFRRHPGPAQASDQRLAVRTWYLSDLGPADAAEALGGLRPSLMRGLGFALRQRDLPRAALLYSAARVAAVMRYEGCTHLHAHFAQASTATAIVAARWLGIGVSFAGHGRDVYAAPATPADLALKLDRVDFAVAVCEDMRRDFTALAPRARVGVLYCGVDPRTFAPVVSGAADADRLLFIGRLRETKGVEDLLEALALVPAAHRPRLDLVGDGPLREALQARCTRLGLDDWVEFLGVRPAEWLARHGPGYRALVAPFRIAADGDRDTDPVVVKEAMAMALPVVTTMLMGCKEMVTDETGWRVAPGDRAALARALETVATMAPLRLAAMGQAGRRRLLELFTAERQARALSALVEEV
ncbi:glycosyl transferase family 1 [Marichromatium purpuratum 984]|uniref:Glycosyl transferase family 1 n=1 Tax=Marichromatium purpuratum 984 TaxID=765910 RepID=W0E3F0_MARPU|nr:glycosyltransferase [Marichromatium purpuratum]AHF03724.1 glycosyl transferase family 1 [Marichromatium purpuratum 984]